VQQAAECEEGIGGEEIGITKTIYDLLPADVRAKFTFRAGARCYVAAKLRTDILDAIRRAREYDSNKPVAIGTTSSGATTIRPASAATAASSLILPSRPFACDEDNHDTA